MAKKLNHMFPKVIWIRIMLHRLSSAKKGWGLLTSQIRFDNHTTRSDPSWPKGKTIRLYRRNLDRLRNTPRILPRFSSTHIDKQQLNRVQQGTGWQKFSFRGITPGHFSNNNLRNQNCTQTPLRKPNWDYSRWHPNNLRGELIKMLYMPSIPKGARWVRRCNIIGSLVKEI